MTDKIKLEGFQDIDVEKFKTSFRQICKDDLFLTDAQTNHLMLRITRADLIKILRFSKDLDVDSMVSLLESVWDRDVVQ